jgi:hypothetical protein
LDSTSTQTRFKLRIRVTMTGMTKTSRLCQTRRMCRIPGAAQTTLAFKVGQSKILEFYGQKGKDNITAIVFIRKIDDLPGLTDGTTLLPTPMWPTPSKFSHVIGYSQWPRCWIGWQINLLGPI